MYIVFGLFVYIYRSIPSKRYVFIYKHSINKRVAMQEEGNERTTVAIKMKTRTRLDNLGFGKHYSYDEIINRLVDRWQVRQPEMDKLDEFYKRFTNDLQELTYKMLGDASAVARESVKEILNKSQSPKDISKVINERAGHKEVKK